jgi:hypothetical protein
MASGRTLGLLAVAAGLAVALGAAAKRLAQPCDDAPPPVGDDGIVV